MYKEKKVLDALAERAELEKECKVYIAECEFMIKCLEDDPDGYAVEITIVGQCIGLTDGFEPEIIKILKKQIVEAQKCINGKENAYE